MFTIVKRRRGRDFPVAIGINLSRPDFRVAIIERDRIARCAGARHRRCRVVGQIARAQRPGVIPGIINNLANRRRIGGFSINADTTKGPILTLIARLIRLMHEDVTIFIIAIRKGKTIARSLMPGLTAVIAVFPAGPGFDTGYIHHVVVGNAVAVTLTRVFSQLKPRRCRRRGITVLTLTVATTAHACGSGPEPQQPGQTEKPHVGKCSSPAVIISPGEDELFGSKNVFHHPDLAGIIDEIDFDIARSIVIVDDLDGFTVTHLNNEVIPRTAHPNRIAGIFKDSDL